LYNIERKSAMTIEKKQLSVDDKTVSAKEGGDRASEQNAIKTIAGNEQHQRLKQQDALKSFKLTGDEQSSFVIDMGEGHAIQDTRQKRPQQSVFDAVETILTKLEDATQNTVEAEFKEFLKPNDFRSRNLDDQPRESGRVDYDYSGKPIPTRAPDDVTVIGAEGTPGQLWKPDGKVDGKTHYTEVSADQIASKIGEIQQGNPSKGAKPRLVYINACHSGEGNWQTHSPDGASASKIAKETHSYVLGNIGLGDSLRPDRTFVDTKPWIPGMPELHGKPWQDSTVRLFGPDGKPCAEFKTPVDWKEVKAKVAELESKRH
jgi:hypothetical protein